MFMLSFTDTAIVLSMFILSFVFVIVCVLLSGSESVQVFYRLFIYVLTLKIQLSRGEAWIPLTD